MRFTLYLLFVMLPVISNGQTNNPVVIELFTSQGCSSCPSADKNLSEILQQAKKEGREVYGLSFHVDYWNYIGWKDPYSSKEFTARQRKYADNLNLGSIYTPQMIVNGKDEFVGSNKGESLKALETAYNQKPVYQILIKDMQVKNGFLNFQYTLDKRPNGEVINMAIVERDLENYVPRGENNGRKLHHDNVVRGFTTHPLKQAESAQLLIPDMNLQKATLIVYIQNKDFQIIGASAKSIE